MSPGGSGIFPVTENVRDALHSLVPTALVAFMRQKNVAPFTSGLDKRIDNPVLPALWTRMFVKAVSVASWNPYESAPCEAFQRKRGEAATFVALSAGETSSGGNGACPNVVNDQTLDHGLAPPTFEAFARQ